LAFTVGGLGVVDTAYLPDDGVDRPRREPPAPGARPIEERGQEQRLVSSSSSGTGVAPLEVVG